MFYSKLEHTILQKAKLMLILKLCFLPNNFKAIGAGSGFLTLSTIDFGSDNSWKRDGGEAVPFTEECLVESLTSRSQMPVTSPPPTVTTRTVSRHWLMCLRRVEGTQLTPFENH